MAEAYTRAPGDQATPGYRPLPGAGPARGADLRTTVVAGLGIALGIFAGTFIADGTVQRMMTGPSHRVAQVSSNQTGSATSAAAPAVSTPHAGPVATPQSTALATSVAEHHEAAPAAAQVASAKKPQAMPTARFQPESPGAAQVAAAQRPLKTAAGKPGEWSASTVHKVTVLHRHRFGRRLVVRRAILSRRHGRARHRARALLSSASAVWEPASVNPVELNRAPEPAGFTVEGSLTVSSFDPFLGTVQTYEGEDFALGKTVHDSSAISWLQYPADIHYICDQSGSCTLKQGRVAVGGARRTK